MHHLTDIITDKQSADEIETFFGGLGLPVPERGEFYEGHDKYLTFLTDYGILIRITPAHAVVREQNPHFMRSLFNRKAGKFEIDIDPGLQLLTNDSIGRGDVEKIRIYLKKKYGLKHDWRYENLAFIPGTEYPILIDLDAKYTKISPLSLLHLSHSAKEIAEYLRTGAPISHDEPDLQNCYDPLRIILNNGWSEYHISPANGVPEEFFRACLGFKKAGKLRSDWETHDYFTTKETALRYAEKIRTLPHLPRPGISHT